MRSILGPLILGNHHLQESPSSRLGYLKRFLSGLYEGCIGITEKKMETTVQGLGFRDWGFGTAVSGFGV